MIKIFLFLFLSLNVFAGVSLDNIMVDDITILKTETVKSAADKQFNRILLPDVWDGGCWDQSTGYFYGTYAGSLYISKDFLKTRTLIDTTNAYTGLGMGPVVLVTKAGSIIWGYVNKLRRSTDKTTFSDVLTNTGGTSWWPVISQSPTTDAIVVTTYGSPSENAFVSKDDGATWTKVIDTDSKPLGISYAHLHMAEYAPDGALYVHTGDGGSDLHTLKSVDDGANWNEWLTSQVHPTAMCSFEYNSETVILWGADYWRPAKIFRTIGDSEIPTFTTVWTGTNIDSGSPQDVFSINNLGNGVFLAYISNDKYIVEWPYWVVSEDYGLTWRKIIEDKYSQWPYAGVTKSTNDSVWKKWVVCFETLQGWNVPILTFLVTYGGDTRDIGR